MYPTQQLSSELGDKKHSQTDASVPINHGRRGDKGWKRGGGPRKKGDISASITHPTAYAK